MQPSATVLRDSISPAGIRLTTMQITMHRFVLAEFNTHRQFARNFRSSRAVPVARLMKEVKSDPAMPVVWLANKSGMQGGEVLDNASREDCTNIWQAAARDATKWAESLMEAGLHKSWANRLLEPFLMVHGVVSSTKWANFYALRCHMDAQPEIKALADAMWEAQQASTPQLLQPGDWHLPYVDYASDIPELHKLYTNPMHVTNSAIRLSVARCARVSYSNHDGTKPSIADDLRLYDRLVSRTPLHASPAEHQATPDMQREIDFIKVWDNPHQHGNFHGWRQHRKTLHGECVYDPILPDAV